MSDNGEALSGPLAADGALEREAAPDAGTAPLVVLVGNPNVGKSVMFHNLTGRYVTVSNYPGTTVEVTSGRARIEGRPFEVVDTPGMYSLIPISDEERVARRILLERAPALVIHMVDAKNLERMLPLTLQLAELDHPLLVVLNMMDEAERIGLAIDLEGLAQALGVRVVSAVATSRRGMERVRSAILELATAPRPSRAGAPAIGYEPEIEAALERVAACLPARWQRSRRGVALLLLQQGEEITRLLREADPAAAEAVAAIATELGRARRTPTYAIATRRQDQCRTLCARFVRPPAKVRRGLADRLSEIAIAPLTGVPILLAVLYLGLYRFVGIFGGGTVVGWLEKDLFGGIVNPWFNALMLRLLPAQSGWQHWTRELVAGDYGVVTLGLTYAFAIVLPIVSLFFLFFSVLEDSGYFPRLAMLVDRVFKRIGLNGRAVIPLVLGIGCGTMATLVTRIQETKRERLLTTFLLALAIPCSAQFGVTTALLAKSQANLFGISLAFLIWLGVVGLVFVLAGLLASRLVPGEPAMFYMELPPLRWPRLGNVLVKTLARMKWYFAEILPLFIAASLFIWVGRLTGLFELLLSLFRPFVVGVLGLPAASAEAFLYGFFRRDFGAAGLFTIAPQMTGAQILVACVTLTLFMPCIAQFLVMRKERGWRATLIVVAVVFATAFSVGGLLSALLRASGVTL
jgi:ferrous iron transport protein B